ncbi:hypothetical protein B0J13DRAFT_571645 [Dactylonectria estremocensis]|uniref:Uncharacterized protein n=1 Tax=Dactylonectria estremocensis TaxID=1079267 RepID=A0A9P9ID78_9HYPO|nr:hypothetical protein B0J13DRAFT_571645 [Dactylonectria estremocensis]
MSASRQCYSPLLLSPSKRLVRSYVPHIVTLPVETMSSTSASPASDTDWDPVDGLHPSLTLLFSNRCFWTDFWWTTEAGLDNPRYQFMDEHHNFKIHLPLSSEGDRLELSLSSDLGYFELIIAGRDYDEWNVAHDDQAHWHPHVLRWEEVEIICRAAAHLETNADSPLKKHPGVGMLLLMRWAPICLGDDVDRIAAMLEVAFGEGAGGVFSLRDVHRYIAMRDFRDAGFRWTYDETKKRWALGQDEGGTSTAEVYSCRTGDEYDSFPHDEFRKMLAQAAEMVKNDAPMEPPPRDPEARRYCRKPQAVYSLELRISETLRTITDEAAVANTIDLALRACELGSASRGGMMSCGGSKTADLVDVRLNVDEIDRAVDVVRDILRWGRAPESCAMRGRGSVESIALKLDDDGRWCKDREKRAEMFFMLADMDSEPEEEWMRRSWEERLGAPVLDDIANWSGVQRAAGDVVLDEWAEVKTEDGGRMRVYITNSGEGVETKNVLLAVSRLTTGVAEGICTLLETALDGKRLALMPPAIVTKEPPKGTKRRTFTKVDAIELFGILERGSYAWWI